MGMLITVVEGKKDSITLEFRRESVVVLYGNDDDGVTESVEIYYEEFNELAAWIIDHPHTIKKHYPAWKLSV